MNNRFFISKLVFAAIANLILSQKLILDERLTVLEVAAALYQRKDFCFCNFPAAPSH